MATIKSKTLFFTTSPRSPLKMIPEIELLANGFEGRPWNAETQTEYMQALNKTDFFQGSVNTKNPGFSARDRINRGPKAYGFVDLKPTVSITEAGHALIIANHKEEVLLRQLVKFQLPSPFHTPPSDKTTRYRVKPYLEILRLIRRLGTVSFDEMMLFGMQLVDYSLFEDVVQKINDFRVEKANSRGNYRNLLNNRLKSELCAIYAEELNSGNFRTRETETKTVSDFMNKKRNNLRDYTDACFRYLRATGVVTISQSGRSLSIAPEKIEDVDYLLSTIDRNPVFADDENLYKRYLFDPSTPKLYSDDFENLRAIINEMDPGIDCQVLSLPELKDLRQDLVDRKREDLISRQADSIKKFEVFDEIIDVFQHVRSRDSYYDRPLMFEWNTWRSMVMIDGGHVTASLKFDDAGRPLSTAAGNRPDVVCDYGDFILNVEVTLQTGHKQYDNEGEPIARHVGQIKEMTGKPTYCFFIAPKISEATIAHFFVLSRVTVKTYGGKATIVPLELTTFEKMVSDSKRATYTPNPLNILRLIKRSQELALEAENEIDWFERTKEAALGWLGI